MTAPLNLDALQALCDAATAGEWFVQNDNEGCDPAYGPLWMVVSRDPDPEDEPYFEARLFHGVKSDADFIATARSAMPALIQEVRRLQQKEILADAVLEIGYTDLADAIDWSTVATWDTTMGMAKRSVLDALLNALKAFE